MLDHFSLLGAFFSLLAASCAFVGRFLLMLVVFFAFWVAPGSILECPGSILEGDPGPGSILEVPVASLEFPGVNCGALTTPGEQTCKNLEI